MFVSHRRSRPLIDDELSLTERAPDPGADHGEVFTRRWVVELILDLVGYTPDKDLATMRLVEPSCGTGAFLLPAVERLIASNNLHGHDLGSLGPAVAAFDLLDANAERARKAVCQLLTVDGLTEHDAHALTSAWITTDDFLLRPHASRSADFVVGNPPYVRLENIARRTMDAYRRTCPTMRGRADIYVGFIERGLDLLKPGGALSFICADRWMRNQYGADLRELITSQYAMEAVISMHDVDAFEEDVSAYPAIVVVRNGPQERAVVVDANSAFDGSDARTFSTWARSGRRRSIAATGFTATRVDRWFAGRDLWPTGTPANLAIVADLEARFPPLQNTATKTLVGIGLASGCDDVYLTTDRDLTEPDRLLPMAQSSDITSGRLDWSGTHLVNPWGDDGLVDLRKYPKLARYLAANERRVRDRFVARRDPDAWYRTIDKVNPLLADRPKLLLPDLKAASHPVLDEGGYYPHHNLYFVISERWDLQVLGGLLLSDFANLFVGAYCVRMRGGCYRFQAQYLRRIRVPSPESVTTRYSRELATAFVDRDVERATAAAARLYGVDRAALR